MTSSSPQIRPATNNDLDAILRIQDQSPGAAHWSGESYKKAIAGETRYAMHVGETSGEVAAFSINSHVADETELLNIAVAPEHRRRGLGALLLAAITSQAAVTHLEVRAGNTDAIAFYDRAGFVISDRRNNYYRDPPDDAVLMRFDRG